MRLLTLLLLLACLAAPARADQPLTLIPLQHMPAEELLPTLRQVLGEDGSVTAYNNQLILRASPGKVAEIQQLLKQLDVPLRTLLISVRTDSDMGSEQRGASVHGTIGSGRVQISNDGDPRTGVRANVIQRSTTALGQGGQQVRAIEGQPALVGTQQNVPRRQQYVDAWGRVVTTVEQEPVNNGFWVTARVQGNQALIEVRQQRGDIRSREDVRHAAIDTRLQAPLGEWVPLGGTSDARQTSQSGSGRVYTSRQEAANTWIRVDVVGN